MGQKRQPAGLPGDVADDRFDQSGFDHEPGALGRALDRAPQLLLVHGPDQRMAFLERGSEAGVGGAVAVEIGSQSDDHSRLALGTVEQHLDEGGALLLVPAEREDLLELVDDEERCLTAALELLQGVDAGRNDRRVPRLAHDTLQRRHQARPHERGLAASRRPHHGQNT